MINAFYFPTEEVKMIYDKYDIIKCYMYLNLTDTESFYDFSISSAKRNVTFKRASPEI